MAKLKKVSSKESNDNSAFLKTINSSRVRGLATKIFDGVSEEELGAEYGIAAVSQMQGNINKYNENPEDYIKNHPIIACKTC